MNRSTHSASGLESILEIFGMRFEYDTLGRIVRSRVDGVTPRFVLGRSREGCIWRFSAGVEREIVRHVAKLAGRESAFSSDPDSTSGPPERWASIERLFDERSGESRAPSKSTASPELVTQEGVIVGEIWTID